MNLHKNFIIKAALCCLLIGMMWFLGPSQATAQSDVSIPDVNLRAVIQAKLGISAHPIPGGQIANLTELIANDRSAGNKISNLSGLQNFTSLTHLNLAYNEILAVGSGGTAYLPPNLTHLSLAGNGTNDISELAGLVSLTHLNLSNNSLTDTLTTVDPDSTPNSGDEYLQGPADSAAVLRHLASLTSLQVLNVSHNSIVNIKAVQNMTALTDLIINDNKISNFSPLVENTGLGSGVEVRLGGNRFGVGVPVSVSDLEAAFLRQIDLVGENTLFEAFERRYPGLNLDEDDRGEIILSYPGFYGSYALPLMNKGVTLYSSLGKIVNIPDRDLRDALKTALLPFLLSKSEVTRHVQESRVRTGYVESFIDLRDFFGPEAGEGPATLQEGSIINPFAGQPSATATNYFLNLVRAEPLTAEILGWVYALDVSVDDRGYWVQDLTGLDTYCPNLAVLYLKGTEFAQAKEMSSYEVIGRLTKLRVLDLSDHYTTEVELPDSFKNLKELRWLGLHDCKFVDISALRGLTALERLDLRHNRILTLKPLENLTNLRWLNLHPQRVWTHTPTSFLPGNENRKLDYDDFKILRTLANRIQHPWFCDTVIVKSYGFAAEPLAYTSGSHIIIEVIFQGEITGPEFHTATEHLKKPELFMVFDDFVTLDGDKRNVELKAEWLSAVYDEEEDSTTVEFAYPIDSSDRDGEVILERLRLSISPPGDVDPESTRLPYDADSSAMLHWRPLDDVIFPGPTVVLAADEETRSRLEAVGISVPERGYIVGASSAGEREAYPVRSLHRGQFLDNLPLRGAPIAQNPRTVQMSRAGGETGTATDEKFDVEITFSGPLNEASATALASKISFGDVAGVSVLSLTRPGVPTTYEQETWTLSVAVAAGVSGDVTVTLDPEGLRDVASPSNPVAAEGSTLSITVPVNRPGESVPDTEPVTVGSSLEFSIVFEEDGVTYEGTEKPYITIYVGEQEQANERHAVWARERDVNSTEVTFEYQIGAGDIADEVSLKPEEGIAIPRGTTFVSETVRIVGDEPPASGPGEAPPPPTQQSGGGGPDPGQPAAGSPQISTPAGNTRVSLTTGFARPTVLKRSVQILGVVYLPPEEETKADASGVPRSPVVFNELGNGSGDSNDWLEFRNVTGAAVSLKDWELSVVQNGEKKDTSLIVFPDVSVPANGLLLITNSDPTADGNRLAGGDNVATSAVETKGSSHLYLVNSGLALPDDGKFLLILRKSKEKLGKDEAFVDVAGGGGSDTDAFIREQAGEYDTHVWPLQVREAPGADTEDALGSGKVWQRAKADIVGYHKDAWAEAAFTGIGYDRAVSKSAATAGTPGYPNGALKTEASTPKGSITISEVMFDSGGGKLPQWIELYNKSKTEAINLNRWRLELQNVNSEDLIGRPIVTLTLGEKVIQPNQTLLIVSGDARASASARLPADRVYNLFDLHEKNLRIKKQHDTFLSAVGFYLKLSDRNGTKIDEVGNTDGNRRTDDAPSWAFPVSPEEGVRSSLIRRYTKGTSVAEDGMERGGWVLASNVKRFVADKELHWGHADDIGTPGYRAGGPLPVELSSFSVKRAESGAVVLTWTTESEVDNAGFNLRRSEKRDSGFTLLNPALIAGAGTTGERQAYTFTDTSAKPGVEYYYRIEEVAFDGGPVTLVTRFLPGPVSASNRMLTTFGAVKSRD